jgi:GNAT superfamily N-acetyltransferase
MIELDPAHYESVLPLVSKSQIHGYSSYAFAVLEGRQPGHVFADDTSAPQSALVVHAGQPSLLCGKANSDGGIFLQQVAARFPGRGTPLFWTASDDWHRVLVALPSTLLRRIVFFYPPSSGDPIREHSLPNDVEIRRIDEALLEAPGSTLKLGSVSLWGGPAGFIRNSFGFCALHQGQVGSFCAAAFIGGGAAEIDISTAAEFRRMGLAAAAGDAFLRYCREQDLRPNWSCRSDNLASAALAEKLGFVRQQEISGWLLG